MAKEPRSPFPAPPAKALETSTCWRLALRFLPPHGNHVEWYETVDRALRAYDRHLGTGADVWLISPPGKVVAFAPAVCAKCLQLGYPPEECHLRRPS